MLTRMFTMNTRTIQPRFLSCTQIQVEPFTEVIRYPAAACNEITNTTELCGTVSEQYNKCLTDLTICEGKRPTGTFDKLVDAVASAIRTTPVMAAMILSAMAGAATCIVIGHYIGQSKHKEDKATIQAYKHKLEANEKEVQELKRKCGEDKEQIQAYKHKLDDKEEEIQTYKQAKEEEVQELKRKRGEDEAMIQQLTTKLARFEAKKPRRADSADIADSGEDVPPRVVRMSRRKVKS